MLKRFYFNNNLSANFVNVNDKNLTGKGEDLFLNKKLDLNFLSKNLNNFYFFKSYFVFFNPLNLYLNTNNNVKTKKNKIKDFDLYLSYSNLDLLNKNSLNSLIYLSTAVSNKSTDFYYFNFYKISNFNLKTIKNFPNDTKHDGLNTFSFLLSFSRIDFDYFYMKDLNYFLLFK